jgi:hypothetical protein
VTDSFFCTLVGGSWLVVGQEQRISCKLQVVSCKKNKNRGWGYGVGGRKSNRNWFAVERLSVFRGKPVIRYRARISSSFLAKVKNQERVAG